MYLGFIPSIQTCSHALYSVTVDEITHQQHYIKVQMAATIGPFMILKGHCHRDFAVFKSILCKNQCIVPLLVHKMFLQNYEEDIK